VISKRQRTWQNRSETAGVERRRSSEHRNARRRKRRELKNRRDGDEGSRRPLSLLLIAGVVV